MSWTSDSFRVWRKYKNDPSITVLPADGGPTKITVLLDVFMLLTTAPDSKAEYERYKKTVFPVGFEYSYQPQQGFRIAKLTLGTHLPVNLIFGKWENKEKREGFLANISKRVPGFHEQRRALFPYFDLTYYEMPRDINFTINKEKYNVVTSFWKEDSKTFLKFLKQWEKQIAKAGGKIILQLTDGKSPTGYTYNPDLFYIIEWADQLAFDAFAENRLTKAESSAI